ncbi:MAG: hypothetical protein QOH33_699, partial [Paraburkholderia sp.]|nr:hypothetical protein [Paraburkholderia sp.]
MCRSGGTADTAVIGCSRAFLQCDSLFCGLDVRGVIQSGAGWLVARLLD